jgi:hypothetical protein
LLSRAAHIDQATQQSQSSIGGVHGNAAVGVGMRLDSAASNDASNDMSINQNPPATLLHKRQRTNTCAVWKRRDGGSDKQLSYLIVDALLEESGINASKRGDEADVDETNRTKKRPKLTVLDTIEGNLDGEDFGKTKKKKNVFKVLDPLSRMIDDSLQMVFSGEKMSMEHYDLITTDESFAMNSMKWLVWRHSSGGNLLHSCALWNDVNLASDLCKLSILPKLASALDGDERTPYELAQLSGHGSVCQVLEAFGGDTFNYVYDIYDLDEEPQEFEDEMKSQVPDDKSLVVELKGGVGYWTPDGELILEASGKSGHKWGEDDNADEEGEIDSNCEEYGGNDYPDEEWGDGADNNDDGYDYDEEEGYDDTTFRDRVVDFAEDDYVLG